MEIYTLKKNILKMLTIQSSGDFGKMDVEKFYLLKTAYTQ